MTYGGSGLVAAVLSAPGVRVLELFRRTVWRQGADSEATRKYLRRVRGDKLQRPDDAARWDSRFRDET